MTKLIKDTEIQDIFSKCIRHIGVLLMTAYCKSSIGFISIITKKLSYYQNKHNVLKCEMTSSRETGGAAGIHIILCGDNKSRIQKICYDNIGKVPNKGRNFNTQTFRKMYLFVICMISLHWFQTKLLLYIA